MVSQPTNAARFRRRAAFAASISFWLVCKSRRRTANVSMHVLCEEFVPWGMGRATRLTDLEAICLRCKLSKARFATVAYAIRPFVDAEDIKQAERSSGYILSAEL